jgi:hypothetical protein
MTEYDHAYYYNGGYATSDGMFWACLKNKCRNILQKGYMGDESMDRPDWKNMPKSLAGKPSALCMCEPGWTCGYRISQADPQPAQSSPPRWKKLQLETQKAIAGFTGAAV